MRNPIRDGSASSKSSADSKKGQHLGPLLLALAIVAATLLVASRGMRH